MNAPDTTCSIRPCHFSQGCGRDPNGFYLPGKCRAGDKCKMRRGWGVMVGKTEGWREWKILLKGVIFFLAPRRQWVIQLCVLTHCSLDTSAAPGPLRSPWLPGTRVVTCRRKKSTGKSHVYIYMYVPTTGRRGRGAEEYVGCPKAVGSVSNCSAVISVSSQRGDALSLLTDRPWMTAPLSFPSVFPFSLSLPLFLCRGPASPSVCVPGPYNEIHYCYR